MSLLACHPEATGDPATIRWVVPPGTLDFVGAARIPGQLMELGITHAVVTVSGVELTLPEARLWRERAGRIRSTLLATLNEPACWEAAGDSNPDKRIGAAVEHVLAGPQGDFIRSHGGEARLVEVRERVAVVEFTGSCRNCAALGFTLHGRIEQAVQELCPDLPGVKVEAAKGKDRA